MFIAFLFEACFASVGLLTFSQRIRCCFVIPLFGLVFFFSPGGRDLCAFFPADVRRPPYGKEIRDRHYGAVLIPVQKSHVPCRHFRLRRSHLLPGWGQGTGKSSLPRIAVCR